MTYLLSKQILSSMVLNSNTVLELTVSAGKLLHTGVFLKANEFDLTDLFSLGLLSLRL